MAIDTNLKKAQKEKAPQVKEARDTNQEIVQLLAWYRHAEGHPMTHLRDIPPVAGAIIWARQIEPQLFTYMKRVEDVLGIGWENYAEGSRLARW
ncbi:hypothetical protein Pst134EA_027019 [Puccinia striiformis f. sp. tritici]|uniref:hypothetical protein n=1 Tax=Puccinia striiformis f. sp. tritici TaxID=168172 RepID=UPI0020087699|nr:hypothetical protein Pst134EA_027019 [Puccinia striiformis f. sp. tritici]KAH9450312.1 hypothetical protein Pst134EA_027019 [Puccinia striiformis f. sp. tritici]